MASKLSLRPSGSAVTVFQVMSAQLNGDVSSGEVTGFLVAKASEER